MWVEIGDQIYELTEKIASGGEGDIYSFPNNSSKLIKVYRANPDRTKIDKLLCLIKNNPNTFNKQGDHISVAFPEELVFDSVGEAIGFTMPKVPQGRQLVEVYSPKLRNKKNLSINWQFLIAVAVNLCALMETLKFPQYVVGDLKAQNILVNAKALCTLIDVDSIQVQDLDTTDIYYCTVASPETTPPELIGKTLSKILQWTEQDNFRLAVLIYQILFGEHPFKDLQNLSSSVAEAIKNGKWIDAQSTRNFYYMPSYLRSLFELAFIDGLNSPSIRPSASRWKKELLKCYKELIQCDSYSKEHYYHPSYGKCPWCKKSSESGFDIFLKKQPIVVAPTSTPTPVEDYTPDVYTYNLIAMESYVGKYINIRGIVKDIQILEKRKKILRITFEVNPDYKKVNQRNFEINITLNAWGFLTSDEQLYIMSLKGHSITAAGYIEQYTARNKEVLCIKLDYSGDVRKITLA